jgi:hypothetical protein
MPPITPEPNDEERQEKLEDDFDPPFSPPDDVSQGLSDDNQVTDTNLDSQEFYDEGLSGAAEVTDPLSRGASVTANKKRQDPEAEGYDIEPTEDEI